MALIILRKIRRLFTPTPESPGLPARAENRLLWVGVPTSRSERRSWPGSVTAIKKQVSINKMYLNYGELWGI